MIYDELAGKQRCAVAKGNIASLLQSTRLVAAFAELGSLAFMKTRHILAVAGSAMAFLVVVVFVASTYWEHKQRPFQNTPRLINALQAFSRDEAASGRRLPPEISLQDLLRGGYLATNDVAAFEGMDVTFSTRADDTNPQMVLARARTPDGQFICLLADGSVQQFSSSRYEQMLKNSGQQPGTANGSQPVHSQTNSTPGPPAGSRG